MAAVLVLLKKGATQHGCSTGTVKEEVTGRGATAKSKVYIYSYFSTCTSTRTHARTHTSY